jgi:peroxiredoxin
VAVHRRLLFASLGAALVVSVVGGWALSSGDDGPALDAVLDTPGTAQIPGIETNEVVAGAVLPTLDLRTNDGATISTDELLGTPLVINLWYSTCEPCKKELPAFAAVQAEYGDRVRFIGVNPRDVPETNESFARERGVQYELLLDPDGAFTVDLGVVRFPSTFFVAANGTIVRQSGVLDEDELRAHVEDLLS